MLIIIETAVQTIVAGLVIGVVLGLMSTGVGLIYGVMKVVNFAQGEFLMLGMYATFFAASYFGVALFGATANAYLSAVVAGAVLFVVGYLVHVIFLGRLTGVKAMDAEAEGHYPQMILTLGLSLIIQNMGLLAFGSLPRQIRTPAESSSWSFGIPGLPGVEVFIVQAQVWSGAMAILATGLLYVFVNLTLAGKKLRAAADNPVAALYMGIDVAGANRWAFALGAAVTGLAGGLLATYSPFQPYIGFNFVITMYAGVVLGGLGSILGAFWGGLIIGFVQQLATLFMPMQLQNAAVFVLFLIILFVRPQGLFGRSVERV